MHARDKHMVYVLAVKVGSTGRREGEGLDPVSQVRCRLGYRKPRVRSVGVGHTCPGFMC